MAGHNKWSKVKRIKGALDQKRGKIFSKRAKEITVAARTEGSDPAGNVRLCGAMPEESTYEGCAPGGAALLNEVATDNKVLAGISGQVAASPSTPFSNTRRRRGSPGRELYL